MNIKFPYQINLVPIKVAAYIVQKSEVYIKKMAGSGKINAIKKRAPNGRIKWYIELYSLFCYLNRRKGLPRDEYGRFIKGNRYSPSTEFKPKK